MAARAGRWSVRAAAGEVVLARALNGWWVAGDRPGELSRALMRLVKGREADQRLFGPQLQMVAPQLQALATLHDWH